MAININSVRTLTVSTSGALTQIPSNQQALDVRNAGSVAYGVLEFNLSGYKAKKLTGVYIYWYVDKDTTNTYSMYMDLGTGATTDTTMSTGFTVRASQLNQASDGYSRAWEKLDTFLKNTKRNEWGCLRLKLRATASKAVNVDTHYYTDRRAWVSIDNNADLPPAQPIGLSPNDGTAKYTESITCSWTHVQNAELLADGTNADPQKSSTLQYRINNGTWVSVAAISGTVNKYTFLANTFKQGDRVEWSVHTSSTSNGDSPESQIATITIGPTPPEKPVLIYPKDTIVNGSSGIRLEWQYRSNYDTKATKHDVSYKVGKKDWVTISTTETYISVSIEEDTEVYWKVRSYGQSGDVGEWSDESMFTTIGKPQAPSIVSVTKQARPVVSWFASDLHTWEICVYQGINLVYETGEQPYITEFSHKINTFLADGQYSVRLRIKNQFGYYSDWVNKDIEILTVKPSKPILTLFDDRDTSIRLNFTNTSLKAYIYRSVDMGVTFVPIGETSENYFNDFTVLPYVNYHYFLRVVDSNDSYNDSDIKSKTIFFEETVIAKTTDLNQTLVLTLNLGSIAKKSIGLSKKKEFIQFLGREYPNAEINKFKSKNLSLAYYIKENQYQSFEELVYSDNTLLLRDKDIGKIYGVIDEGSEISKTISGYTVSFSFIKLDYNEEVSL